MRHDGRMFLRHAVLLPHAQRIEQLLVVAPGENAFDIMFHAIDTGIEKQRILRHLCRVVLSGLTDAAIV